MGGKLAKLGLAVGAVASIGTASPAAAEPICVGTREIAGVCVDVDPTGGTLYEDCVYLASSSCTPVHVPGPTIVDCHGWIGDRIAFC